MGAGQKTGFVPIPRATLARLEGLVVAHRWLAVKCLELASWTRSEWFDRYRGEVVHLEPGEFITSLANLSVAAGLSVKQVRDGLLRLGQTKVIATDGSRAKAYTRVTVIDPDVCAMLGGGRGHTEGTADPSQEGTRRATGEYVRREEEDPRIVDLGSSEEEGRPRNGAASASVLTLPGIGLADGTQPGTRTRRARAGDDAPAVARRVIEFLNREADRSLSPGPWVERVRKLLAAGHSEAEMRLVVGWACDTWKADERMREYITPRTLFPLKKPSGGRAFEEYLDLAREKYRKDTGKEFPRAPTAAPPPPKNGAAHAR